MPIWNILWVKAYKTYSMIWGWLWVIAYDSPCIRPLVQGVTSVEILQSHFFIYRSISFAYVRHYDSYSHIMTHTVWLIAETFPRQQQWFFVLWFGSGIEESIDFKFSKLSVKDVSRRNLISEIFYWPIRIEFLISIKPNWTE